MAQEQHLKKITGPHAGTSTTVVMEGGHPKKNVKGFSHVACSLCQP